MMLEKKDALKLKNLLLALKKATFNDMTGEEILAFNQCFSFVANIVKELEMPVPQKKVELPENKVKKKRGKK